MGCDDAYSSTIELLGELSHLLSERSKTGNNCFSHNEIDNEGIVVGRFEWICRTGTVRKELRRVVAWLFPGWIQSISSIWICILYYDIHMNRLYVEQTVTTERIVDEE